ncbi:MULTISPECIES: hypothetical protein [Paenibacillus]|uniref:Uncharacterized protein n=1 Tax=Paenibacillus borealis TaxID=160799 RepID=A0ABX3GQN4_PAEBO|nr:MULTISPECIES: hypothetical protein [Paenibacillus]OMD34898.1 hypothetical protein BSK56_33405 [Paenibacillus borealis]
MTDEEWKRLDEADWLFRKIVRWFVKVRDWVRARGSEYEYLKKAYASGYPYSIVWGASVFLASVTVYRAWCYLYGKPTWKEIISIFSHDLGYWGKPNMDGEEGGWYPEVRAKIVKRWLGEEYQKLVLYHSRHYAKLHSELPIKLCWADKLSIMFDPKWFYLLRARSTGEIKEYRKNAGSMEVWNLSDSEWVD